MKAVALIVLVTIACLWIGIKDVRIVHKVYQTFTGSDCWKERDVVQ